MTLEPYYPKRHGRPPKKEETVADRPFKARQEKLRQAEQEEPLTDFDLAAIAERLTRKR